MRLSPEQATLAQAIRVQIAANQPNLSIKEIDKKVAQILAPTNALPTLQSPSQLNSSRLKQQKNPSPSTKLDIVTSVKLAKLQQHYAKEYGARLAETKIKELIDSGRAQDGTMEILLSSIEANESPTSTRTQPGGFINVGATCWFNSLVQSLFKFDGPYKKALDTQVENAQGSLIHAKRANHLRTLIKLSEQEANPTNNETLIDATKSFIKDLYKNQGGLLIGLNRHEDADSGYRALIEYLGLDVTHINSLQLTQKTKSLETNSSIQKSSNEPLIALKPHGKNCKSIQDLINSSNRVVENLSAENGYKFSGDYGPAESSQRMDYLTSASNPKIGDEVVFSLPRFTIGQNAKGDFVSTKNQATIQINPRIKIPLYTDDGSSVKGDAILQLKSLVYHVGNSLNSGHYITYVRAQNGTYTAYNDDNVKEGIPESVILEGTKKNAYLATYQVVSYRKAMNEFAVDLGYEVLDPPSDSDSGRYTETPPIPSKVLLPLTEQEIKRLKDEKGLSRETVESFFEALGASEFNALVKEHLGSSSDEEESELEFHTPLSSRSSSPTPS
ncbi:MAG: hypothetical protein S4CHLAM7_15250 [Chlamydiae bacterium]|nr:hypothetical protein [Chlamydiota bacterium]